MVELGFTKLQSDFQVLRKQRLQSASGRNSCAQGGGQPKLLLWVTAFWSTSAGTGKQVLDERSSAFVRRRRKRESMSQGLTNITSVSMKLSPAMSAALTVCASPPHLSGFWQHNH